MPDTHVRFCHISAHTILVSRNLLCNCQEEEARETNQHRAVGLQWVDLTDAGQHLLLELGAQFVAGQLGQVGPQARAAIPVDNRLITGQRVVIVRLSHVHMRGERSHQVMVGAHVEMVAAEIAIAAHLADVLPPTRLKRHLAHDDMRRQVDGSR